MMNDTTKEYNGKNAFTNQVCHTLRLRGSWNLVTLTSRVGEGMRGGERGEKQQKYLLGGCPIREVFFRERLPQFSHAMMRQLLLHSILLSYFTSKIFHFFFQQIKASTQLLI